MKNILITGALNEIGNRLIKISLITIVVILVFSCKSEKPNTITFVWQAERHDGIKYQVARGVRIQATENKNFTVNWGDSTTETKKGAGNTDIVMYHTYVTAGEYTVNITTSDANCKFTSFNCVPETTVERNISALFLFDCRALESLYCRYNQLTNLDVNDCSALKVLHCYGNQLTNLEAGNCSNLIRLDFGDNHLEKIDLRSFPSLIELNCYDNQLTNLDLTNCSNLQTLLCCKNELTNLDLTSNSALQYLDCCCTKLTNLDLRNFSSLHTLICSYNLLPKLNLTDCSALKELSCGNNQLINLDLSNCSDLKKINCGNNQLTNLDVTNCLGLKELDCSNNQLSDLDLTNCLGLKRLDCRHNLLTNLDLSNCSDLADLYCRYNKFQLSVLFALHLLIAKENGKLFCTQNLQPQTVKTGEELFSDQSVFNEIFTKYIVTKNGNSVPHSDYTVRKGKLKFNTIGNYTVTMTNDAIISYNPYEEYSDYDNECPAKVIVDITVER